MFLREGGSAKILGSAVQQDGPSTSLTAPNGASQQRLLRAAVLTARRLEAHGTGDPIGVGSVADKGG